MKKNYFLHTAILLVALVCGTVPSWGVTISQNVTFGDWSKVEPNGKPSYDNFAGDQIFVGSDGVDYTWNFKDVMLGTGDNSETLQVKKTSGTLTSPIIETENGFDIVVYYTGGGNSVSITEIDTDNTNKGASPLTLSVSSSSCSVSIKGGSSAAYISKIEIKPLSKAGLQDPELVFTEITGDITKSLTDGSYNSAATTESDATITYSSSNQEVATIDQQGLVTLLAGGTTVIKAEVKETSTYKSEVIQYTLTVKEPTIITGTVTFNDWSKIKKGSGNGYVAYEGDQIFVGDDEKDYVWNFYQIMPSTNAETKDWPQAQKEAGKLISPAFETTKGFTYTITFKGGEVTLTGSDGKTVTGASPLSFTTSATNCTVTMSNPTATTYIEKIVIDASTLEDPALAFPENITTQTVKYTGTEPFNSAVSTISTGNITYTSSNQEVATIDSKGIVTIIGVGETTIKASIEANATHKAGAINYTLIVRNASAELPYSTDFKSGLGDWINYTLAGTTVWESTTYGAQANGHGKGASEVYLVSPSVKAPNIILAFSSEKGYTGNDLQLFYSTDFDPSSMSQPSDASWTEITDKATWATSQETTESGNIELNNLTAPIRFAFKYTCTAEESARWTITNLSISANNSTGIEEATANEMKVINGKGQVTIETAEAMPIAIYALTGAQVRQIELVEGTNIIELPTGIYLIGNKKVVVF